MDMNYYKILILLILFPLNIIAQENKEQIAFDYFLEKIINDKYSCEKSIYFSGATDNKTSVSGVFSKCYKNDESFDGFRYENDTSVERSIEVKMSAKSKIKRLKKPRSRKLNVAVYRVVNQGGNHYVYISVLKENHFVDHYLIKIIDDKVVDYCTVNETI